MLGSVLMGGRQLFRLPAGPVAVLLSGASTCASVLEASHQAVPGGDQQRRSFAAGQPIADTHPEFLGNGELLPRLAASEFAERRQRLANLLPPGAVAVLPAAAQAFMSGVIPYPYRQDADFLYLTGITQQGCFMVLETKPGQGSANSNSAPPKYTMFVASPNTERERWDGVPLRSDVAREVFGADQVHTTNEMPVVMKRILDSASAVYYNPEAYGGRLHKEVPALRDVLGNGKVKNLKQMMHKLRWKKSPGEIGLMRDSAKLAADGIMRCMQLTKTQRSEQFLAATFEHHCKLGGAQRLSYPAVVAGGADACTIHYIRNDKMLKPGELVLMDAGCELWGYASDVTRTWPVGGKFTPEQLEVYLEVLDVHRQCLDACRAGSNLRHIHNLSVRLISQAIVKLGLLEATDAASVVGGSYRPFYCHSIGHWLGLDTHDTNTVAHDIPLEAGVVMTVEPGIYIPNDPSKFGKYAGIGVRIEDDALVRPDGQPPEILSASVPTDPMAIEALVQQGPP